MSCCNRTPSSRERRSNSRPSQPAPVDAGTELSERDGYEERKSEGGLSSTLSVGSVSPRMTESRLSSIPMKSRINLRVMRCQNDSLPSISGELAVGVQLFDSSAELPVVGPLMVCSARAVPDLVSARWLITLVLLRLVSFSISSSRTLDLHCSILSFLSVSMLAASWSSTASNLFCTLDILLCPIDRLLGLKRSKCHSCS